MNKTITMVTTALALLLTTSAWAELKPGSVVIYSDGDVEKLLQRDEQWTLWEDQRKRQYKRAYLPYIPVLEYRRFEDQPSGYDQSVDNLPALALKPFSQSERVQFSLKRQDLRKGSSDRVWQCFYNGTGRFELGKKRYATDKYRCKRFSLKKFTTYILKEEIWFYYSPTLDLVMKQVRTNSKGQKSRVEVTKILSPERATAKRISRTVYRQRQDG